MDDEFQELQNNYDKLARRLRAKYIERFLELEQLLTEIIADYFCAKPQVREQFYSIVYPELFFRQKVKILYDIIYARFPSEIDAFKPTRKELQIHNEYRNRLIHSMLDRSPDYIKKGYTDRIRILNYRKGEMISVVIKESDIDKKIEKMQQSYLLLTNIKNSIEFDKEVLGVYAGGAGVVSKED